MTKIRSNKRKYKTIKILENDYSLPLYHKPRRPVFPPTSLPLLKVEGQQRGKKKKEKVHCDLSTFNTVLSICKVGNQVDLQSDELKTLQLVIIYIWQNKYCYYQKTKK